MSNLNGKPVRVQELPFPNFKNILPFPKEPVPDKSAQQSEVCPLCGKSIPLDEYSTHVQECDDFNSD